MATALVGTTPRRSPQVHGAVEHGLDEGVGIELAEGERHVRERGDGAFDVRIGLDTAERGGVADDVGLVGTVGGLLDTRGDGVCGSQQRSPFDQEHLAGAREAQAASLPVEQRRAELFLKLLYRAAQRLLAKVQRRGCGRHAAGVGHCDELTQPSKIRHLIRHSIRLYKRCLSNSRDFVFLCCERRS